MSVREVLERQAAERNAQLDADVAAVLETAAGRRALMGLLAKSGVWARTGCGDGDAVRLAYAAGRRDAGADLLGACNRAALGLVALAMQENNERVARWNEQVLAARQAENNERAERWNEERQAARSEEAKR